MEGKERNCDDGGHGDPPTTIDSGRLAVLQLVTTDAVPGTLAALARLNVFEALAREGDGAQLTVPEIAALAMPGKHINVAYLGRLLRMMSAKKNPARDRHHQPRRRCHRASLRPGTRRALPRGRSRERLPHPLSVHAAARRFRDHLVAFARIGPR